MSETPVTTKPRKQDDDPDAFMQKAKEGLEKQREEVLSRRATIDEELAAIDGKLERIESYFNPHKAAPAPAKAPRQKRVSTGTRKPREGGKRDRVLAEIAKHPEGISRQDLMVALSANDPKSQQSVSNMVSALRGDGKLDKTTPTGIYKAA